MHDSTVILLGTAASVACLHVFLGPDHYLPFVAMARAGRWSRVRLVTVTLSCGMGHVLGSAVLGLIGLALGAGVLQLQSVETGRAKVAAWLFLAFGLAYFVWGLRRAIRRRPHAHWHVHADGTMHAHEHAHFGEHLHVHRRDAEDRVVNCCADLKHGGGKLDSKKGPAASPFRPWLLFLLFLFGPCEPLIPIIMYAAADGSTSDVLLVVTVFACTTVGTMTAIVLAMSLTLEHVPGKAVARFARAEPYGHALAGLTLVLCGVALNLGL